MGSKGMLRGCALAPVGQARLVSAISTRDTRDQQISTRTPLSSSRRSMFTAPWPRHVVLAWGIAATVFTLAFATWCYRYYYLGRRGQAGAAGARQSGRTSRRKAQ